MVALKFYKITMQIFQDLLNNKIIYRNYKKISINVINLILKNKF